jgi:beta-galactosidase
MKTLPGCHTCFGIIARCLALVCVLGMGSGSCALAAGPPVRRTELFTDAWRFLQSDAMGAEFPGFDDSSWKTVTLPHDWAIAGPVEITNPSGAAGGFFPAGIGWYRKTFEEPAGDAARRTFIVFDGVMANSDVWINGEPLGHRPYGYVSFVYDLSDHLRYGATNTIAVRVDDSQQPASRWYPGAGINRQVRLVTTSSTHIEPWGTFVTTPSVSATSATIHVRSAVVNQSAAASTVRLVVSLVAPDGREVKTFTSGPRTLAVRGDGDLEAETTLANPERWDLDHPALYKVRATLLEQNRPIDEEIVPIGIREFHFDADKGFFLNGRHHKIYGVALHTDAGALGTAVPLAAWERRLTALRALGVNAIRTAHNPPAPEFLDLADRMGFLVMEEMFDCWTVGKNPYDYHLYFKEWSLRDTADTVRRDRNHPSIILWSAGNEIHDTPHPEIAIPILRSLVETFHKYDPTRPVTQALFRPNASHDYTDGLADLLDVVGQNYREQEILAAHAQKPSRKIIGTENTHDRNQWVAMRDHPEYSGQFLWTGVDYLGEAGRWPAIGSGSGLLLSTSLPHGRAFERQSWWADPATAPMVRMARRVQAATRGPIDPGYASPTSNNQQVAATTPPDPTTRFNEPLQLDWTPGELAAHMENVEVFTNADEVELFLNGRSLGIQRRHPDASPIIYQVGFEPGTLKAVARIGGKEVATDELRTAGKPAKIMLSTGLSAAHLTNASSATASPALTPDFNDVAYVTATLLDHNGVRIPDSASVVHFDAGGPGRIVAVGNGNMLDHESFQASDRRLYGGNAVAIVRATRSAGTITVTASAEGLPAASVTIPVQAPRSPEFQRSF